MTPPARRRLTTVVVLLMWAALMATLLPWGLPTSGYDPLLFGGDSPWPARRYHAAEALEARRSRLGGADTDLDPLSAGDRIVELTAGEADRAAILLRYRLYSRQPDEMITFQALSRMNPRQGDFDPRLYQYGGGWIYVVAAGLGAAHVLGAVQLSSDLASYLESPEAFARFYLVARLVVLVFGAFALLAVKRLGERAGGRKAGWLALVVLACCPAFITAALEAKPHLPAVCMLLWALNSALELDAGRRRAAWKLGLQVGYAFGLVLTGLAGLALWPLLAKKGRLRRLLLAGALFCGAYAATNPYVVRNALLHRELLAGNLANSTAMYRVGDVAHGMLRVASLLVEGTGPAVVLLGLLGLWQLLRRWPRQTLLTIAPAGALLALGVLIGAGKPAEFARFLLLPMALLAIGSAAAVRRLAARRPTAGWVLAALLVLTMRTGPYVRNFWIDARFENESRHRAAGYLEQRVPKSEPIGLAQQPAPYAVGPLDFAHRRVVLLPAREPAADELARLPGWLVLTADDRRAWRGAWWTRYYREHAAFAASRWELSRISWANKPVYVLRLVAQPGKSRPGWSGGGAVRGLASDGGRCTGMAQ